MLLEHMFVHCTKISDFFDFLCFFELFIRTGAYELGSRKTISFLYAVLNFFFCFQGFLILEIS
jgi:hypothetical protein